MLVHRGEIVRACCRHKVGDNFRRLLLDFGRETNQYLEEIDFGVTIKVTGQVVEFRKNSAEHVYLGLGGMMYASG